MKFIVFSIFLLIVTQTNAYDGDENVIFLASLTGTNTSSQSPGDPLLKFPLDVLYKTKLAGPHTPGIYHE